MTIQRTSGAGGRLDINTVTRKLRHYNGTRLLKEYPVAVGKPSTPTPPGEYKIKIKIMNPGGVLGSRWMGLSITGGNYGIHGTNNPSSIGQAVSLGCIRMHNHHVEELFPQVSIGTPVRIYNRAVGNNPPADNNPATPAPSSGGHKTYTVGPGDTLWNIARKFNVPMDQLIAVNNITNPDRLHPGEVLVIP